MEQEFYSDNFENLIKENADQFKMYPSKKVWQGIYNNVRPGTSWPSLAMSVLFMFTLVVIGPLNTQQSEHANLTSVKLQKDQYAQSIIDLTSKTKTGNITSNNSKNITGSKTIGKKTNSANNHLVISERLNITQSKPIIADETENNVMSAASDNDQSLNNKFVLGLNQAEQKLLANDGIISMKENKLTSDLIDNFKIIGQPLDITTISLLPKANINPYLKSENLNINEETGLTSFKPNTQINTDNFIEKLPDVKTHKHSKISWMYYLSPSVSYRNFYQHNALGRSIIHRPSTGLEVGTAMKYSFSTSMKLISGIQINYSAYTIRANNIHPTMSSLLLYNLKTLTPYTISSISYYGNGEGNREADLSNYSVQLSLPVGVEFKIAGNSKMQLYTAGTFQPSFNIVSKAYFLSTDKNNYMTYAPLLRKWNMSTNIGAFISTNSNKLNWQIGPQINYQILSSYSREYPLREHFVNYGIRFGISKIKK